jgi:predicted NBD/HSP70 family sugar kinase
VSLLLLRIDIGGMSTDLLKVDGSGQVSDVKTPSAPRNQAPISRYYQEIRCHKPSYGK